MIRALRAIFAVAVVVAAVVLVVRTVDDVTTDEPTPPGGGDRSPATVPPAPSEMPAEGMYVISHVTASGQVEVQTWLRAEAAISELDVTTTVPDLLPGSVESLDVVVRTMDGTMLARRDTVGTNPQRIRLRKAVSELYFSYLIEGGMDDASPTVEGRMLARVLAMDVDYAGAGGVVRRLVTTPGTVLNVACLRPSDDFQASPRACGKATTDGGWTVELRGPDRRDRLIAQLAAGP